MSVLLFAIEVRVFHVISKEINVKLQYTLSSNAYVGYRGFAKFKWILTYKKIEQKENSYWGSSNQLRIITKCNIYALKYSFSKLKVFFSFLSSEALYKICNQTKAESCLGSKRVCASHRSGHYPAGVSSQFSVLLIFKVF